MDGSFASSLRCLPIARCGKPKSKRKSELEDERLVVMRKRSCPGRAMGEERRFPRRWPYSCCAASNKSSRQVTLLGPGELGSTSGLRDPCRACQLARAKEQKARGVLL